MAVGPSFFKRYENVLWDEVPELQRPVPTSITETGDGPVRVSFTIAWAGRCGVSLLAVSDSAIIRGAPTKGLMSLVLPILPPTSRLHWNGTAVSDNDVINTAGAPISWSLRGSCTLLAVTLGIEERQQGLFSHVRTTGDARTDVISFPDEHRARLRSFVERTLQIAAVAEDWHDSVHARTMETGLAVLVFDLLESLPAASRPSVIQAQRRRQFSKLLELFEVYDVATLDGLAEQLGVSKRALNYVCRDFFGLAPMEALRLWRLNAARRTLRQSRKGKQRIWKAASQFGFGHPGRFAVMYKKQFGESPSATLREVDRR